VVEIYQMIVQNGRIFASSFQMNHMLAIYHFGLAFFEQVTHIME